MMGMAQTQYSMKNFSSVMLFDCDHPDNQRLSLWDVNHRPGRDLHQFYWLDDDKIGPLQRKWNQLVGVTHLPITTEGIVHWTLGSAWFDGWVPQPYDHLWLAERDKGI